MKNRNIIRFWLLRAGTSFILYSNTNIRPVFIHVLYGIRPVFIRFFGFFFFIQLHNFENGDNKDLTNVKLSLNKQIRNKSE